MTIKALEQQPCDDVISREAVLNLFNKSDEYRWEIAWIRRKIEKLSSVIPKGVTITDFADRCRECGKQTRWIPVSERLPEDYIHVLCQFTLGGMGECYLAHGAFHVVGGLVMTCNEVIAWMPIPEPYTESEEV